MKNTQSLNTPQNNSRRQILLAVCGSILAFGLLFGVQMFYNSFLKKTDATTSTSAVDLASMPDSARERNGFQRVEFKELTGVTPFPGASKVFQGEYSDGTNKVTVNKAIYVTPDEVQAAYRDFLTKLKNSGMTVTESPTAPDGKTGNSSNYEHTFYGVYGLCFYSDSTLYDYSGENKAAISKIIFGN